MYTRECLSDHYLGSVPLELVLQLIFVALLSTDHGNKSLFNLAISKELSERLIGVQNAPATKYVTMVIV